MRNAVGGEGLCLKPFVTTSLMRFGIVDHGNTGFNKVTSTFYEHIVTGAHHDEIRIAWNQWPIGMIPPDHWSMSMVEEILSQEIPSASLIDRRRRA